MRKHILFIVHLSIGNVCIAQDFNVGLGMTVGGVDKSYYVKKVDEQVGIRLFKKNYDAEFKKLFSECLELVLKLSKKLVWTKFDEDIEEYLDCKE